MRAIVFVKGAQPQLQMKEVEKPTPQPEEILIKVQCSSVNAADYRAIQLGIRPKHRIYGAAVAGTIEEVGSQIKNFKPGDEVIADLSDRHFGGWANYALATEKILGRIPKEISFEDAATLPVAATTAYRAVVGKGELKAGEKVLIVGSGGGVGSFALQMAKHIGAHVTAVCGTHNVDEARSFGADHVIDYTQESFIQQKGEYDLVLAVNGNYPFMAYKKVMKKNGRTFVIGGAMIQIIKSIFFGKLYSAGSKKIRLLAAGADGRDLEAVAHLMAERAIVSNISNRYSFEETPEALAYLRTVHGKGKVVIQVSG